MTCFIPTYAPSLTARAIPCVVSRLPRTRSRFPRYHSHSHCIHVTANANTDRDRDRDRNTHETKRTVPVTETVIVTEERNDGNNVRSAPSVTLHYDTTNSTLTSIQSISTPTTTTTTTISAPWGRRVFGSLLPAGYPSSVGANYGTWAASHVGRHIFRNAHYTLGTTTLLVSLGLSTNRALVVSSALKWVLKDGVASTSKLVLSTRSARWVDGQAKSLRVYGDVLMSCASLVELCSMTAPRYFLIFASCAAALKAAGDALSGPAYRVCLECLAGDGGIGDVSARGEAQVVFGNLIGLALGVLLTKRVDVAKDLITAGVTWSVLAIAHIACTYNAVRAVELPQITVRRLIALLDGFEKNGCVTSVEEFNQSERFVNAQFTDVVVVIGVPVSKVIEGEGENEMKKVYEGMVDYGAVAKRNGAKVEVAVTHAATTTQIVAAVMRARTVGCETEKAERFVEQAAQAGWKTERIVGTAGTRYKVTRG